MSASIIPRRSADRGSSEHGGWLASKFTFSFAGYSDPRFDSFGLLRVLNDDTVKSGGGFPTHSHSNFEIWSYILSGGLEHKDSMGMRETLTRGHVQLTTGGTGISHSEYNADKAMPHGAGQDVRFLQIWALPSARGLKPAYQTGHYPDALKRDQLCPILVPAAATPAPAAPAAPSAPLRINTGLSMLASILSPGANVSLPLPPASRAYIHVPIMPGSAGVAVSAPGVEDVLLSPGDGAFVQDAALLSFRGLGEVAVAPAASAAAAEAAAAAAPGTEFVVMHFAK